MRQARGSSVASVWRGNDRAAQQRFADEFEAGANSGKVCAHDFVTPAVQRDPTLDNNAVQAEGQARCIARQLAELAAGQEKPDVQ